jgi:hypothetical protein
MNLATNQCAQRRDRTNVCMCHLDHLLQLPWAHRRRVPPTEAARPELSLKDDVDCGASKASPRVRCMIDYAPMHREQKGSADGIH